MCLHVYRALSDQLICWLTIYSTPLFADHVTAVEVSREHQQTKEQFPRECHMSSNFKEGYYIIRFSGQNKKKTINSLILKDQSIYHRLWKSEIRKLREAKSKLINLAWWLLHVTTWKTINLERAVSAREWHHELFTASMFMPKLLLLLPLTNLLPSEFKQELTGRFLWLIKFLSVNSFFLGAKTSRSLQLCKITLLPLHFFFSLILSTAGGILAVVVKPHSEFCIFWNGCAYIYQVLTRPDLGPYANTAVNCHCQLYTTHATLNASQKMKIAWLHGWTAFFSRGDGVVSKSYIYDIG